MRGKIIFWAVVVLLCTYVAMFVYKPRRHHPPGQIAPQPPVQEILKDAPVFEFKNHAITPLARIAIQARVLSTKTYWFDSSSKLSPIDLALGWGSMSDSIVLSKLRVTQSGRWYEYSWKNDPPLDPAIISVCSANMHMIPSTPEIRKKLLSIHRGDIVEIVGLLVAISGSDGFKWSSSLTRTDQGGGACEVVYVESLEINPRHD